MDGDSGELGFPFVLYLMSVNVGFKYCAFTNNNTNSFLLCVLAVIDHVSVS
jgi:hypothetical protein